MFLDDDLIPVVPEWEEQIKQLDEIKVRARISLEYVSYANFAREFP